MKIKFLFTAFIIATLAFCNKYNAQSVTYLPGETLPINYSAVFTGDGNYNSTTCYFHKAKGMLCLAMEVQKDGLATWAESRVALFYGGTWHQVYEVWTGTPNTFTSNSAWDVNRYATAGVYPSLPAVSNDSKIVEYNTSGGAGSSYLVNKGNLRRYNGNYLPLAGDVVNRTNVSQYANFSIQTIPFSNSYNYPVSNPDIATGVQAVSVGADRNHANQNIGNLPGVGAYEPAGGRGIVYINLSNLPPDMLELGNFRVHLYQNSNTAHDRIYEWVYTNQNFMTNAPLSLSASNNKCGMVTLNWGNSTNTMPTDGTMDLKTVIFRDGNYLAMVNGNVSTYNDVTAAQDVTYQYSLKHVAWSESYHTYLNHHLVLMLVVM